MDGILVVDKPKGMTSHDVVSFIRKRFGLKKVGHAGTLDPMATGVLVMLIGKFTKSSSRFTSDEKEYEATLVLGATSDTGDAWGRISESARDMNIGKEQIGETFKKFSGEIEQIPPMYSAVKVKGKKLYEFARRGIDIERQPRKIFIRELKILKILLPEITFKVICSKGTYVRQLATDIGNAIGCGGYLSALKRMRSGHFDIARATGFEELKTINGTDLEKRLLVS